MNMRVLMALLVMFVLGGLAFSGTAVAETTDDPTLDISMPPTAVSEPSDEPPPVIYGFKGTPTSNGADSFEALWGQAHGIALSDADVSAAVADFRATISGQSYQLGSVNSDGTVTLSWYGWEQTCPPNMICILGGFWHFVTVTVDVDAGVVLSLKTSGYLISSLPGGGVSPTISMPPTDF